MPDSYLQHHTEQIKLLEKSSWNRKTQERNDCHCNRWEYSVGSLLCNETRWEGFNLLGHLTFCSTVNNILADVGHLIKNWNIMSFFYFHYSKRSECNLNKFNSTGHFSRLYEINWTGIKSSMRQSHCSYLRQRPKGYQEGLTLHNTIQDIRSSISGKP